MFNKILFPTDGSEHSKRTLDYVKDLARNYKFQVVLFHSYSVPILGTIEHERVLKESGMALLDKTEQQLKKLDIQVISVLSEGRAGSSITDMADKEGCDLIVMGTHGLSETKTLLIGSTSNYVLHHAKCPVLLINYPYF